MKIPNWFQVAWWLILLIFSTRYLHIRYPALINNEETFSDKIFLSLWVALTLLPLIVEIEIFGFSIKRHLNEVEQKLSSQIIKLKMELQNSIAISSNITPHITFNNASQSDNQIQQIEEVVRQTLEEELKNRGLNYTTVTDPTPELDKDTLYMITARISLEKEIRRIYTPWHQEARARHVTISEMIRTLVIQEVISGNLAHALHEVYIACSKAIHGQEVTNAQQTFVRDVTPGLLATLKAS